MIGLWCICIGQRSDSTMYANGILILFKKHASTLLILLHLISKLRHTHKGHNYASRVV